jgi:hypothetical protein
MTIKRMFAALAGALSVGGLLIFDVAPARADGAPVVSFQGAHAVASPDGKVRYAAQPGRGSTKLQAIRAGGILSHRIPGRFIVPVVAADGTPSGLSANGRTLVLVRPVTTFPARTTRLAIIDPNTLRERAEITLRGDFSLDAISPNGEWAYLIQYTNRRDATRYVVRALNLRTHELLRRDIVDPHDADEQMRGNPLSRVQSAGGDWAYTLYDGDGKPFLHALDTARLTARCIDLPLPAPNAPYARLRLSGPLLLVIVGGHAMVTLDTRTFAVARLARGTVTPAPPNPAASPSRARRTRTAPAAPSGDSPWVIVAGLAMLAALASAVLFARRRRIRSAGRAAA